MTSPEVFTFAVYPTALDGSFDVLVLDVPTLSGEEFAARRAWWTAFHQLGPRGIEPEQFTVCELNPETEQLGRLVTSGGLTELTHAYVSVPGEVFESGDEVALGLGEIDGGGA